MMMCNTGTCVVSAETYYVIISITITIGLLLVDAILHIVPKPVYIEAIIGNGNTLSAIIIKIPLLYVTI
jgi:hypothetical protein